MKATCLAIGLLFVCAFSFAKSNDTTSRRGEIRNTIIFSAFGAQLPRTYSFKLRIAGVLSDPVEEYALGYERFVSKKIILGIGYAAWDNHPYLQQHPGMGKNDSFMAGAWEYMQNYKMGDLYAAWKFDYFKRHIICIGAGLSYTRGENTIVDTVYITPGWFDGIVESHEEIKYYWGGIAFISYDYLLLHNRLAIGYKVQIRKYQQWYSTELDMGFSLKFNF